MQTVKHIKSGGMYTIVGHCMIEATKRPGVLYRAAGDERGTVWCRDAAEFWDGRFQAPEIGERYDGQKMRAGHPAHEF